MTSPCRFHATFGFRTLSDSSVHVYPAQAAIDYAVPMPLQTKDGLYLRWLDAALKESFARFQARLLRLPYFWQSALIFE